jgi:hypothetical protein
LTQPLPSPSQPIPIVQKFEDFYRLFQDKPGVFKYQDQINEIFNTGGSTLVFLYEDLLSFDPQIAEMLKKDPENILEDAVEAFKNVLKLQSGKLRNQKYFVRITTKDKNSTLKVSIRGLRSKHIDELVWNKGILVRISSIRPKLIKAQFECNICGATFEVPQLTSKIRWPKFCTSSRCKAKSQNDFRLVSKTSEFIDWQSITIQEVPEDLPPGRIPRAIQGILTYDLVDTIKPGDRIQLMGIYKSVLAQSIKGLNSTLFKTYIDVNYLDPEDKSDEFIDITKDDLIAIEKLSKEPLIQKKIARSVAPPIYGRDDLKMACALSLFGGSRRRKPGGGFKRGDIHVLFVGDPGTGKSIHGSEKIYIGKDTPIGTMWKTEKIGDFANKMLNDNKSDIILKGDTEILRLLKHSSFYTYSINPDTLKTQKSKINEISRHKTNILVNIKTESGRVILTTLNHSFTTLLNGKLKVIDANDLIENFENIYLPVARNLNFRENFDCINFSNIINKENLVEAAIIRRQIQLYHNREITLSQAAKKSNITEGTFLSYMRDLNSIPNGDWIRSKYDNTWIPRKIKLDDKFGRIIGFYLAEGDIPKNSVRISNTDQEIIRILENDIKKIFHRVSYYDYDDSIQVHNASLRSWFENQLILYRGIELIFNKTKTLFIYFIQ